MDELQKRGGKLLYDPDFWVHRRPRPHLKAFAKMLMNYGRGRAEQFRLHPTPGSALNFVPPAFCVYLAALLTVAFARPDWFPPAIAPLGFYLLALLGQTLVSIPAHGFLRSLLAFPLLFATHVLYGAGFWRGLFTRPQPATMEKIGPVQLEKVS
jgi:hypothetical protein